MERTLPGVQNYRFRVEGMTCAACAVSVSGILKSQEGVQEAQVNYATKVLELSSNKIPDVKKLNKALKGTGYSVFSNETSAADFRSKEIKALKLQLSVAIGFGTPVFVLSMFAPDFQGRSFVILLLASVVMIYSGLGFFRKALALGIKLKSNMDSLIALGTGAAFLWSLSNLVLNFIQGSNLPLYFDSVVVIISLVLLGRYLEELAGQKTWRSYQGLLLLKPKMASRKTESGFEDIQISELRFGDVLAVKAGESIPADGILTSGHGFVDESMFTGEFTPIEKLANSKVFSGSINKSGYFEMEALKTAEDTFISRIISLVNEAQSSRAPFQTMTDKVAGIFVPLVLVVSLSVFLFLVFFQGSELSIALERSISMLVVACPCALGLATPTAIVAGMGIGSKNGILFKSARGLQELSKVDTLVFDKTGTLTSGDPLVDMELWQEGSDSKEYLEKLLYHVELKSAHPYAKAITRHVRVEFNPTMDANLKDIMLIPGKGLMCNYKSKSVLVGNVDFMDADDQIMPREIAAKGRNWTLEGRSVLYYSYGGIVRAVLALGDQLVEGAQKSLIKLKRRGISLVLLTGDGKYSANSISKRLGIPELHHSMTPHQKRKVISQLKSRGSVVGMVGDGINDGPGLAEANVGLAIGTGTDLAIQAAEVILVHGDISKVNQALKISKKTFNTIRQNLVFAFFYNLIAIPAAAGLFYGVLGFALNPMFAALAMACSSLFVVGNSLILSLYSPKS